jgi:hypothetical protein
MLYLDEVDSICACLLEFRLNFSKKKS